MNALPGGRSISVISVSGYDILDALEMSARVYPAKNSGFLQVSGITFDIQETVIPSVTLDGDGNFTGVTDDYRVTNVMINGKELDVMANYTVAGTNALLNGETGYKISEYYEGARNSDPRNWDDVAKCMALVEKLRDVFPGCAITTDIMVGFPGETDEEFAESMAFAEKVGFAKIHVFPYSIRKGTVAAMRTNQVVPQVKSARAKEMSALADRLERQFLESQVGTVQTVLIEKRISPDYCNGFTGSYIPVRIYGGDIPRHSLVQVKLTSADGTYCTGTTKF